MFWEHSEAHKGEGQKSLRRATAVIGMAPDLDPTTYNHEELDRYGIGKVRSLALFYKLFLIDAQQRTAVQLCPFVTSGEFLYLLIKFLTRLISIPDYQYSPPPRLTSLTQSVINNT